MGWIARLISNKIESFTINTLEKRFGYNVKGETFGPSGDDSPGLPDDKVYLGSIDGNGRVVVIGNLMISQGAEAGEKIIYSRDASGTIQAKIYLKKDGKIQINDGTDYAVRYNELKTQLDQLKQDLNNFITTFNSHTHAGVTSGPSSTGTPSGAGIPSTVDFSNTKIDSINVPGVGE